MRVSAPRPVVALRTLGVALTDVVVLVAARPRPALVHELAHPMGTLAVLGPDRTIATCDRAVLWLVAVWVGLGLLTVAGSQLPGAAGRACAVAARVAVPATLRRLVGVAIGVGLVAGPVTAVAAAPSSPPVPGVSISRIATPGATTASSAATPGPAWPTPGHGPSGPDRPPMTPPSGTPAPTGRPAPPGHDTERVTVRPGDSLWLIAARRLPDDATGTQVAAYWPQVYAANRDVVGPDPDRITPGQALRLPDPRGPAARQPERRTP